MKPLYRIAGAFLVSTVLLVAGCTKKLEEEPHTVFTTDYFNSAEGLRSAVVTLYAGMRYNYGPIGALGLANMGTDEYTFGDQVGTGQFLELGTYQIPTTNGAILTPWNRNYGNINLAAAVLKFSETVSMSENEKRELQGETRFLRALYYLLLVEQFGAVPVDLGSGDLQFTNVAYYGFNRLPFTDVLVKDYQAMIDDLTFASQNLPVKRPANEFRLSQGAALALLSKVYLFRAYSSVKQAGDFNKAYTTAMELINNKSKYGTDLLQDYGQIHKQGNDYNQEILYSVERLALNDANNETNAPGSQFDGKVNIANNMFNANYQNFATVSGVSLIDDRPLQYGRPLRQFVPTAYVYNTAFAEKSNDSRFDNTFRVMWQVATIRTGTALQDFVTKLAGIGFKIGDTAIYLAPTDARAAQLKNAGKKYKVLGPSEYWTNQTKLNQMFPNLKKYDDSVRNNFQDVSGRPFPVIKLSEVYLNAAEAAMQDGRPGDAVTLINVIRRRAAYRPSLTATQLQARQQAMEITTVQLNLDFILDERTRELCGESLRWPDLAMRGKNAAGVTILEDRIKRYNPDGAPNVKAFHVLRPIPQSQIQAIDDPSGDFAKYQNEGYK